MNFIMAIGSIAPLFVIPILDIYVYKHIMMVFAVVVASFLMHISERKHHLPGIHPFNECSQVFLQFDRAVSVLVGLYLVYQVTANVRINVRLFFVIISAFMSLWISEKPEQWGLRTARPSVFSYTFFAVTHTLWHALAFSIMFIIFRAVEHRY